MTITTDVRLERAQRYMRSLPTLTDGITPRSTDTVRLYCPDCGEWMNSLDPGPLVHFCESESCKKYVTFAQRKTSAARETVAMIAAILTSLSIVAAVGLLVVL